MKFQVVVVVSFEARLCHSLTKNLGQGETERLTIYVKRFLQFWIDQKYLLHAPGMFQKCFHTIWWINNCLQTPVSRSQRFSLLKVYQQKVTLSTRANKTL